MSGMKIRRRVAAALLAATVGLGVMSAPVSAQVAGFSDVKGGEYYAAAVAWMRGAGLTTGVGGTGQYQPAGVVSRAQMVTFLWRLAGQPGGHGHHGFGDVAAGTYFDKAVRWAKSSGLTTGVGGSNRFAPNDPVTRAQMAAFLYRFEDPSGTWPAHGFADVPAGSYYDDAVRWLKRTGVTTGVAPGRYAPNEAVTRGQMAAFIWRLEGKPAPPNPGDSKSCGSFRTYSDAKQWFDLYYPYYGDVARLDHNGDRIPCEELLVVPAPPPPAPKPPATPVYFKNCDEARRAGAAPMNRSHPGYRAGLDRDGDGIACE